jgi:vacuolar-type H+-ATPase subunit I/STV1
MRCKFQFASISSVTLYINPIIAVLFIIFGETLNAAIAIGGSA